MPLSSQDRYVTGNKFNSNSLLIHLFNYIDDLQFQLNQDRLLHAREIESIVKDYEEQMQQNSRSESPAFSLPQAAVPVKRVITCDVATSTCDLSAEHIETESLLIERRALRSILDLNEYIAAGFDTDSESIPHDAKWKPGLLLALLKWYLNYISLYCFSKPQLY